MPPRRGPVMTVARTVRLSANENPYGPGRIVKQALAEAIGHVSEYPDVATLASVIATRWDVPPTDVTVGTGGDDLLRRGVEWARGPVVAAWPGFGVYRDLAVARDKPFVAAPLAPDGSASASALIEIGQRLSREGPAGVIFAANPNNPTGVATRRGELLRVARALPDWLVVIDEAYAEFRTVPDPEALGDDWPEGSVIARTLSKIYGLAGLRIGYAVGRGWGIAQMVRYGDAIPVGGLTVAAGRAALSPANAPHIARVRRAVIGRRERLVQVLEGRGFSVVPSETNFVLATPPVGFDADIMARGLRGHGVIVRLGSRLSVPGTIRISVGSGWQERALRTALDSVMVRAGPSVRA